MRKIKSTIINGKEIIPQGVLILDDDGTTLDLIPEHKIDFSDYEHHEGYLVPGFVNTHCHLELSHLKNKIEEHTGLVDFILKLQEIREASAEEMEEAMVLAEQMMVDNGIVAVGDISNTSSSFGVKAKKNIFYHTFLEALGFTSARAQFVMDNMLKLKEETKYLNLSSSISPHAPYSVSRELFKHIAALRERVYTLHHLESLEEIMFLKEKSGDFLRLYDFFNINIDEFSAVEQSATKYWLNQFTVEKIILVHNTFLSDDAYDIVQKSLTNCYWCLCPNANLYIEDRLPNIPSLVQKGAKICIGTDSLASNYQLDILSEIKTIKKHFPQLETPYLLQCATIHGAEALGIEQEFGSFHIGKKNKVLFIENF